MKQNINCALIHTFSAINGIEDSAARITLSMDVTYAHGSSFQKLKRRRDAVKPATMMHWKLSTRP